MNISFSGFAEFSIRFDKIGDSGRRFPIYIQYEMSPNPETYNMEGESPDGLDKFRQFDEDLKTWLEEHVDNRLVTDNENLPREDVFLLDDIPNEYNLSFYLFEVLAIRSRPFGLVPSRVEIQVDSNPAVILKG